MMRISADLHLMEISQIIFISMVVYSSMSLAKFIHFLSDGILANAKSIFMLE